MTIAICSACGARKFGAFTPCERCNHVPQTVLDKSMSLALSDHHSPVEELNKFQITLMSGQKVHIDSISLASIARSIMDDEYYWATHDEATGRMPCKGCGATFAPEVGDVYCSSCISKTEDPLSLCVECLTIYGCEARFCQKCGGPLSARPGLSPRNLGFKMALTARRSGRLHDPIRDSHYLKEFRSQLSVDAQIRCAFELEVLALYISMTALRKHMPSLELVVRCVQQMLDLYRISWILDGAEPEVASSDVRECTQRFDQYDRVLAPDSERHLLFLGNEAVKNCFGVNSHIGSTGEMVIVVGYFWKMSEEVLKSDIEGP